MHIHTLSQLGLALYHFLSGRSSLQGLPRTFRAPQLFLADREAGFPCLITVMSVATETVTLIILGHLGKGREGRPCLLKAPVTEEYT